MDPRLGGDDIYSHIAIHHPFQSPQSSIREPMTRFVAFFLPIEKLTQSRHDSHRRAGIATTIIHKTQQPRDGNPSIGVQAVSACIRSRWFSDTVEPVGAIIRKANKIVRSARFLTNRFRRWCFCHTVHHRHSELCEESVRTDPSAGSG